MDYPDTQSRVVGGGNTILQINKNDVLFLQSIRDTPPAAVGQVTVVQSLGSVVPEEIVTPNAVGAGTITLTVKELWTKEGWQTIVAADDWAYKEARSLLEVYRQNRTKSLTLTKLIQKPDKTQMRSKTYTGCVITNISEDESVDNSTMTKDITITIMYTNVSFA